MDDEAADRPGTGLSEGSRGGGSSPGGLTGGEVAEQPAARVQSYSGGCSHPFLGHGEQELEVSRTDEQSGSMTLKGQTQVVTVFQDGRRIRFDGSETQLVGTICSHGVIRGEVRHGDSPVKGIFILRPEETLDLPPGSFGAGGWAPGGNGQYPRLTTTQAVACRRQFRQALLRRYYSVLRGWKALDRDGNGRLSIFEFMRGCQDLGLDKGKGVRHFWDALDIDRSGCVTLEEVDMDLARALGTLAVSIHVTCGTLDKAWDGWFNKKGYSFRIPKEDFVLACEEIGFPGDAEEVFESLRSDLATVGISREEFQFLEMWFAKVPAQSRSPLHPKAELESLARVKDDRDVYKGPTALQVKQTAGKARAEFKKLLLECYGTYVRAWREGLDRDHNGVLDYDEFRAACHDIGYAGPYKVCWTELDLDGNGTVSFSELDRPSSEVITKIYQLAVKRYGSWNEAWVELFDSRGDDRVNLQAFVTACRLLGYGGNPDRLFELLDTDRVKYLSLSTTAWITGAVTGSELPEPGPPPQEVGGLMLTGSFQAPTKSRTRLLDKKGREQRLRTRKFMDRARHEIPGSSTFACQSHFGTSGFSNMMGASGSSFFSAGSGGSDRTLMRQTWHGSTSEPLLDLPGKEKHTSRDPVGYRSAPGVPEYLSGGPRSPAGRPAKQPLDRAMRPQSPGRGGWPLPAYRLVCPEWGGTGKARRPPTKQPLQPPLDASVQLPPATPQPPLAASEALTRCAISAPSLARWRETVAAP